MLQQHHAARLALQTPGLQARLRQPPSDGARLEAHADAFVADLRRARHSLARQRRGWSRLGATVDALMRTDAVEHMDDPDYSARGKLAIAQGLHVLHKVTGAYQRFFTLLEPMLRMITAREGRPARVLELACGNGGFSLEMARLAHRRGVAVEVTGSDIVPLYVQRARAHAHRRGLPVRFTCIDALNMHAVADHAYDVLFIANSVHHFTPGQLARMLAEARRVSTTACVAVDGYRSVPMVGFVVGTALMTLWPAMVHDATISARKFYSEHELEMIARLAAPHACVRVGRLWPLNTTLTVRFDTPADAHARASVAERWRVQRSPLPASVQLACMAGAPERFFRRRARGGDPFLVQLPVYGPLLASATPDGARELFTASPETFAPIPNNPLEPILGQRSLILLAGARHRRERKLISPSLKREGMRTYGALMCARTHAEVSRWQGGEGVSMQEATRNITLDVIVHAVLGAGDNGTLRATVADLINTYASPLLVFHAMRRRFGGLGPWARFVAARDQLDVLLSREIASRRADSASTRDDILTRLMDARTLDGACLTDDELVDELRTLIVGGHDTSTTALVWAFYYVYANPAILARLQEELQPHGPQPSPEVLAELPYLDAVCQEALRLHPPVPIVPRWLLRPFAFRGRVLAPGDQVALVTTLLHRHPDVWHEPDVFKPERFLERAYTPFELAPFGGGARRCVGAAFGAYQMRMVLGSAVARRRLLPTQARAPRGTLQAIVMAPNAPVVLAVAR